MSGKRLTGKVAWVTGSSRGIGRVVADSPGEPRSACGGPRYDADIHATVRTRRTRSTRLPREIADAHGVEVLAVHGDLTSEQVVEDLHARIVERFDHVDILINNAGGDIGVRGVTAENAGKPLVNDAVEIPMEDVRIILDRNLMTCILVSRAVVRCR